MKSNMHPHSFSCLEGNWYSKSGRPSLRFVSTDSGYRVVVFHAVVGQGCFCPVSYPLFRSGNSFYILASGRILVTFQRKDNTLFLSPGGKYFREKITVGKESSNSLK